MLRTAILVLFLNAPFSILASTLANEVIWAVGHFPPYLILYGEEAGQGIYDGQLRQIKKQLTQFEHSQKEMNVARAWVDIAKGHNLCILLSLDNKNRRDFAHFSMPYGQRLPVQLVMRRDTFNKLNEPKQVSLKQILHNEGLTGLVQSSRSYSKEVDSMLANSENLGLITSAASSTQLIKMLDKGRIDYFIEYEEVVDYYRKDLLSDIVFVKIEEVDALVIAYVACTKNAWGLSVIMGVNDLIKRKVIK